MFDVYSGMLRMLDDFRDDGADYAMEYQLADPTNLCETYNLHKIAGAGNDFSRAKNLLQWISQNIFHYRGYRNQVENIAIKLFEYSFGKGEESGLNCRSLSLALTECLLAIGIKARTVYILPFSPYDNDNHVVCEAWISEMGKWVMFDPTYNLHVSSNGICLNALEFRNILANRGDVSFSDGANYNNDSLEKDEILDYYAKNLFRFMVLRVQGSNTEELAKNENIDIAPIGYDVKRWTLGYLDYQAMQFEGDETAEERAERLKKVEEDKTAYSEQSKVFYKGVEFLYDAG